MMMAWRQWKQRAATVFSLGRAAGGVGLLTRLVFTFRLLQLKSNSGQQGETEKQTKVYPEMFFLLLLQPRQKLARLNLYNDAR